MHPAFGGRIDIKYEICRSRSAQGRLTHGSTVDNRPKSHVSVYFIPHFVHQLLEIYLAEALSTPQKLTDLNLSEKFEGHFELVVIVFGRFDLVFFIGITSLLPSDRYCLGKLRTLYLGRV